MSNQDKHEETAQTPLAAGVSPRTNEAQADINKAAHDQAEADIEADIELTDIAGPQEDLDEGEIFAKSDDRNDIT